MNITNLQHLVLSFPGVKESIKWENHLCFTIADKMFLVTNPDAFPISASFKADDEDFENLISREGIIPAPYMARYKWVHLDDINHLTNEEWCLFVKKSYDLVFSKLSVKTKKELINQI